MTKRNSSVECLRILAMFCIVLSHCTGHSGLSYTYGELTLNRVFFQLSDIGNLGVVLFVIITGYFLCDKGFRIPSVSKLLTQVWFYSIGLFLICRFCFGYAYSDEALQKVFLPTVYAEYWFFTAYFLLLVLSPLINAGIAGITRRQHLVLIAALTVCWSLIPTLTRRDLYGSEIPQFLLFYLIGAYFRRYPDNRFQSKGLCLGLILGISLVLVSLTIGFAHMEQQILAAQNELSRFLFRNSILILGLAVSLFAIAVNAKPWYSPTVNILGSCTFGVYLIHDNPAVRELLWKDWLYFGDYFTSGSYILRSLLTSLTVFFVCTAIEYLRQKTVAKPLEMLLNRVLQKSLPV